MTRLIRFLRENGGENNIGKEVIEDEIFNRLFIRELPIVNINGKIFLSFLYDLYENYIFFESPEVYRFFDSRWGKNSLQLMWAYLKEIETLFKKSVLEHYEIFVKKFSQNFFEPYQAELSTSSITVPISHDFIRKSLSTVGINLSSGHSKFLDNIMTVRINLLGKKSSIRFLTSDIIDYLKENNKMLNFNVDKRPVSLRLSEPKSGEIFYLMFGWLYHKILDDKLSLDGIDGFRSKISKYKKFLKEVTEDEILEFLSCYIPKLDEWNTKEFKELYTIVLDNVFYNRTALRKTLTTIATEAFMSSLLTDKEFRFIEKTVDQLIDASIFCIVFSKLLEEINNAATDLIHAENSNNPASLRSEEIRKDLIVKIMTSDFSPVYKNPIWPYIWPGIRGFRSVDFRYFFFLLVLYRIKDFQYEELCELVSAGHESLSDFYESLEDIDPKKFAEFIQEFPPYSKYVKK